MTAPVLECPIVNRARFLISSAALAAGAGAGLGSVLGRGLMPSSEAPRARAQGARGDAPPNVLLVLTDDQDAASVGHMPAVKRLLGGSGVSFGNCFATTPQCSPSRATLLTGRHARNHGMTNNYAPEGGARAFRDSGLDGDTVATRMRSAGYRTGYAGKYMTDYDSDEAPPGWGFWRALRGPYEESRDSYRVTDGASTTSYGREDGHDTDRLAAMAEGFLRDGALGRAEGAPEGGPFFLVFAPAAPHNPAHSAPRHSGLAAGWRVPRPPGFDEADVSDKPAFVRGTPPIGEAGEARLDELWRRRMRSLRSVDEAVGRLIGVLAETGRLDNTLVIFTSDNGWMNGDHRVRGKGVVYDRSVKVPLLARGPGVGSGSEGGLVSIADLAPTILDWCGVAGGPQDAPPADGASLRPLLEAPGAGTPWRERLMLEFFFDGSRKARAFEAVRTRDRLYAEYSTGETELYDLARDPGQMRSRHADPAYSGDAARLAGDLSALRGSSGGSCQTAEGFAVP